MKEIDAVILPQDCRYAKSHEWARPEGDQLKIGISDYAQDQLGDIVFVELPQIGESLERGAEFGTVESVKAVSELYSPVSGEVVAVNTALEESPELVNSAPYDEGWMIAVKPDSTENLEDLMDHEAYRNNLKG